MALAWLLILILIGNENMKLKHVLIIYTPLVLVILAVAIFNPKVLTWPVVGVLALAFGIFGGFAMKLFND